MNLFGMKRNLIQISLNRFMIIFALYFYQGNPIERDRTYQTDILRSNNLMTLDNVTVRPMPPEAVS